MFDIEYTDTPFTHGLCLHCGREFDLSERHISYLRALFCTEECLAEYTYEHNLDVDEVAENFVVHNDDDDDDDDDGFTSIDVQ